MRTWRRAYARPAGPGHDPRHPGVDSRNMTVLRWFRATSSTGRRHAPPERTSTSGLPARGPIVSRSPARTRHRLLPTLTAATLAATLALATGAAAAPGGPAPGAPTAAAAGPDAGPTAVGPLGFHDVRADGSARPVRNDLTGGLGGMVELAQSHTIDPAGNTRARHADA